LTGGAFVQSLDGLLQGKNVRVLSFHAPNLLTVRRKGSFAFTDYSLRYCCPNSRVKVRKHQMEFIAVSNPAYDLWITRYGCFQCLYAPALIEVRQSQYHHCCV
jgi:hypothetical protein